MPEHNKLACCLKYFFKYLPTVVLTIYACFLAGFLGYAAFTDFKALMIGTAIALTSIGVVLGIGYLGTKLKDWADRNC